MIAFKKNMACTVLALGVSPCFAGKTRLMKPDIYKSSVLQAGFTQRSRPPKVKTCTLKKNYIDAIWDGSKTVEGRLNKDFFKRLDVRKGDQVWFHTQSPYGVLCAVTDVKHYNNFESMLKACSFEVCVPEAKTFDDAIRAYHKFYSQKEETEFGVIAWHVQPIGIEKPKSVSTKYLSRVHTKRLQNRRRPA